VRHARRTGGAARHEEEVVPSTGKSYPNPRRRGVRRPKSLFRTRPARHCGDNAARVDMLPTATGPVQERSTLTTSYPPPVAQRLGYLALLPFVLGALAVWAVRDDERAFATSALSAYAAVVVAFLGGIHWGFAARQVAPAPRLFVWGVVPALVASVALLMQPSAALIIHGAVLVACYLVDRKVYPEQGASGWLVLRFRLTGVAALSCFLGAAGG
jgi:hypothetical protein